MPGNYKKAFSLTAKTYLNVDTATLEIHFVNDRDKITRNRKKHEKGSKRDGVTVAKLANKYCQSLSIATFLLAKNESHVNRGIRQTKK